MLKTVHVRIFISCINLQKINLCWNNVSMKIFNTNVMGIMLNVSNYYVED